MWQGSGRFSERRRGAARIRRACRAVLASAILVTTLDLPGCRTVAADSPGSFAGVSYTNQVIPRVPWSVHVVRVARTNASSACELQTAHAGGGALGLTTVTDQIRQCDPQAGAVVAAVNGGFYQRDKAYAGDPRGLQVVRGELISAPDGGTAFWISPGGDPHLGEVAAKFELVWPDGQRSSFGLNGPRAANRAELYTPAVGKSTLTTNGRELVLERAAPGPWLPLRVSARCLARIREVREGGDTPLTPETMVLSLSPALAGRMGNPGTSALLQILTTTSPDLAGVRAAISGGPVLVRSGRRQRIVPPPVESYEFTSMLERHPRTAIGWTRTEYVLVVVDGRQRDLSAGMTIEELARHLVGLGCLEAMNLDGGGSATLWFDGQVRNSPCDGYERPVANSVLLVRRSLR